MCWLEKCNILKDFQIIKKIYIPHDPSSKGQEQQLSSWPTSKEFPLERPAIFSGHRATFFRCFYFLNLFNQQPKSNSNFIQQTRNFKFVQGFPTSLEKIKFFKNISSQFSKYLKMKRVNQAWAKLAYWVKLATVLQRATAEILNWLVKKKKHLLELGWQ